MVAAVCRFGRTAFLLITITFCLSVLQPFANARCDYTFNDGNKLYNYTLSSPIRHFPHGILSEDGFYKVSVNESTLWFQECGGPARCGMECNALVSNNIGGYHVCTTLGRGSQIEVDVIDKKNPHTGVIVKMSSGGLKTNCSLAVSVLCDYNGVKEPYTLQRLGACNYATQLKHPSACAIVVNVHGGGLGWFGTLSIVVVCLFATYLLAGAAYRFFFLGIRGVDAIPNVDFWASLPRRIQIWFSSLVRRFKGPSEGYRSSYSPVNF
ncbi:uncharacterized protein LOC107623898 isoform X2 [Arachis ipaensis]|uniref:uncharacterized protein LOC107623898 isoform X2 n=1 Tax=Arachis ipaensis TaxID=130454 RepID=UPI000A2B1FCA|nr:uncharacterized protein LOC107623898 isoform X2 [Arachis ipaensis]XP_025681478.1 uncharacterized protein LOC112782983 isoform X2 [Arachis hypogaea]